jgi:hypothetical protein
VSSEETIKNLINDNWYFRIENSNDHDYITAFKGEKENSLGIYTEYTWKTIIKLKGAVFYPEDDF